MTKRLIALLMVLMLAISVASMALADPWIDAISVGMGTGGERGGCPDPNYRVGSGGGRPIPGPCTICSYSCLN